VDDVRGYDTGDFSTSVPSLSRHTHSPHAFDITIRVWHRSLRSIMRFFHSLENSVMRTSQGCLHGIGQMGTRLSTRQAWTCMQVPKGWSSQEMILPTQTCAPASLTQSIVRFSVILYPNIHYTLGTGYPPCLHQHPCITCAHKLRTQACSLLHNQAGLQKPRQQRHATKEPKRITMCFQCVTSLPNAARCDVRQQAAEHHNYKQHNKCLRELQTTYHDHLQ
jgi:hypothetical protein